MKLFSLNGRATRAQWWGTNVCGVVAALFVAIGIGNPIRYIFEGSFSAVLISLLIGGMAVLFYFLISFAVTIRRLHDRGRSGWFYLVYVVLNCVPYLNFISSIVFIVDMGILDGEHGLNKYGEDPKGRVKKDQAVAVNVTVSQSVVSASEPQHCEVRFCSKCGKTLPPNAKFCQGCGSEI